ncbi:PH domain-containing protein [Catellatospora vulcania]|uniref:PH domain-containing protein n=1 Tax=Catellatospora vulcania TaxID=1460450 RepID=UPI0012D410CB|nr:PH domain-containing protein [Catellatospora vulcania]
MIGGLGPDEPSEERTPGPDGPEWSGRRERDTEPIPRTRAESQPPAEGEFHADQGDHAHFIGKATVGATAGTASGGAGGRPPGDSASTAPLGDELPNFSEEELAGLRFDASGVPLGPRRVLPLEDEPSAMVARYLFPTERYRGEWKRHWVHLTNPLLIGVFATFALGYLSGFLAKSDIAGMWVVAVVIWALVMSWVAWTVADWYFDRFILTNKRLMLVNGLITRKVAMMPLLKVTDMKYEQSPLGRMLNYGTFVLESAGQDQALSKVEHMPNPNELYLRIVEEMYEPAAVEARLGREAEEE